MHRHEGGEFSMKLTDLSRVQDVGHSSHLVELGPFRIVVDAGLHPKEVGLSGVPEFEKIGDHTVDYIILTHCHLDHLGALPLLKRRQPQAPILTSIPTMMIAGRMLRNSCKIMLKQRAELGLAELPLYGRLDVDLVERGMHPMAFGKQRIFEKDGEQLAITFYSSGHIVGAAGVLFEYKRRKIFFTGDVLFEDQVTLPGASFPKGHIDTVVMETTRGATERLEGHGRKQEVQRLIDTVNNTINSKGACIISTFALGRMQEILGILHQAKTQGKLVDCPIFCSGLGMDLVDYFENIAKKTGLVKFRKKMLSSLGVKKLSERLEPGENLKHKGIYILSSGMLVQHTPSYFAVASALEHAHNTICFVGYCDPDTPGGKLLKAHNGDSFLFDTLDYVGKVRAHVEKFDMSGHAERGELMEFIRSVDPRAVVLTHGDPNAREWFEDEFAIEMPGIKVINPDPLKEYLV